MPERLRAGNWLGGVTSTARVAPVGALDMDDRMPLGAGSHRSSYVQSVDRAVALLRALAASGGTASPASRLLITREQQRMVVRDSGQGLFSLGPTIAELQPGLRQPDLAERARPVLERLSLETGETACLGVIRGDMVHYVAEVIPAIADEESWLGERVYVHASSMGKAFLAFIE